MLSRINLVSNEGLEHEIDEDLLSRVNHQLEGMNRLIDRFNQLPPGSPAASSLLVRLYERQKLVDDSIQTELSVVSGLYPPLIKQYIESFHHQFIPSLQQEFETRGVLSFTEPAVNQWDIVTNKRAGKLPEAHQFRRGSEIARILAGINRSTLSKPSMENYWQLMKAKREIGLLLTGGRALSKGEEMPLENLILKVNKTIEMVLLKNPQLQSRLTPEPSLASMVIENFPLDRLAEMIAPLVMPRSSSSSSTDDNDPLTDYWGSIGYNVQYLGGGNAHNILLTDPITAEQRVLKISPRLGNATRCVDRLRYTEASDHLATLYSSRSGLQTEDGRLWTMEITEYCAQGDLLAHSRRQIDPQERLRSAADMFTQMSTALLRVTRNNALFVDMKPGNFLINAAGRLVIADTKSFLDTPGKTFSQAQLHSDQSALITAGFSPPELARRRDSSHTDKHHAYLMGLNLYLYLTQKPYEAIIDGLNVNPDAIRFDDPVFASKEGQEYQRLIEGLLQPDPSQRLGLLEAQSHLLQIRQLPAITPSPSFAASSSVPSLAPPPDDATPHHMPAKHEEYRWLIVFIRVLHENFAKMGTAGRCPKNIEKMLNSRSLGEIGAIAYSQSSRKKPLRRDEKIHELYGVLSQFARPGADPRTILEEVSNLIKPEAPAIRMRPN